MTFQTPRGTRDFLPEEMAKRQFIIDKARQTFEKWGFDPIDTPAFEDFELLTAKSGEAIKDDIYYFRDKSDRELGLRFEFTTSLARVIVNNPDIPKPFRRYQIGPVWRYDRPGSGRYREFWQADIDIVGASGVDADAEVVACACAVLREIGLSNFYVRINNRKITDAFLRDIGVDPTGAMRAIDKLDKIGEAGVIEELKQKGIKDVEKIMDFIKIRDARKITGLSKIGLDGLEELEILVKKLENLGITPCVDMSLIRGLGYYTGNVFEIMQGENNLTITGGGRYDSMIEGFGGKSTPAVGISLGVDRLANLVQLDFGKTKVKIFVANVNEKSKEKAVEVADHLRNLGLPVEYDLMNRSLGKQMEYVNSKGIKFCVVIGEKEIRSGVVKLRNMGSGVEKEIELRNLPRILDIVE